MATLVGTGDYASRAITTVTFSGYEWDVRDVPSDRGGARSSSTCRSRLMGVWRLVLLAGMAAHVGLAAHALRCD